jgi:site-specific recombinase XerD
VVPIGERALAWGQCYLDEARPQLVADPQERTLFPNRDGRAFQGSGLGERVREEEGGNEGGDA